MHTNSHSSSPETIDSQLLAELVQGQQRLLHEVEAIKRQLSDNPKLKSGWCDTKSAAETLKSSGVKSIHHLRRLQTAGVFSAVRHEIRNTSKGTRPTWQFHIGKCEKRLEIYFRELDRKR